MSLPNSLTAQWRSRGGHQFLRKKKQTIFYQRESILMNFFRFPSLILPSFHLSIFDTSLFLRKFYNSVGIKQMGTTILPLWRPSSFIYAIKIEDLLRSKYTVYLCTQYINGKIIWTSSTVENSCKELLLKFTRTWSHADAVQPVVVLLLVVVKDPHLSYRQWSTTKCTFDMTLLAMPYGGPATTMGFVPKYLSLGHVRSCPLM